MVTLNFSEFAHAAKSSAAYTGWEEGNAWTSCESGKASIFDDVLPTSIPWSWLPQVAIWRWSNVDLQGGLYIDHLGQWRDCPSLHFRLLFGILHSGFLFRFHGYQLLSSQVERQDVYFCQKSSRHIRARSSMCRWLLAGSFVHKRTLLRTSWRIRNLGWARPPWFWLWCLQGCLTLMA